MIIRSDHEISAESDWEQCARIAEQKYQGHGKALGTQRAANYEHAGKAIAAEIRGSKSAALTASPPVVEREAIALALLNESRRFSGLPLIDSLNGLQPHQYRDQLRYADAILALTPVEGVGESFQARVAGWMQQCFGPEIAADKLERNDRFIEESLELVQSLGYSQDRAHALVDYVFGRPVGEPSQEVGGVMVTLAALCEPSSIDLTDAAETELARILQPEIVAKIRAKQAAKPTGSALPIPTPVAQGDEVRDALEPFADFLDHMGRGDEHDGLHVFYAPNDPRVVLKVGDFRRAKAALATLTKGARDAG
jgi:hypothetical protein